MRIAASADPLTLVNDRAIIDECLMRRLPGMHTFFFETCHGALIAYGIDISENYRRVADYVHRILRGAKVADLPFQEPTTLSPIDSYAAQVWGGQPIAARKSGFSAGQQLPEPHEHG